MIVAGIFRRLKEAREQGERHGSVEEDRAEDQGDAYNPSTLRQTNVIVMPNNKDFVQNFPAFDSLLEAINEARRQSRDYVTDDSPEDPETDWSVAVNCAHLHPEFGKKSAEEELQELQEEESQGEVDVNYQEYKEKRLLARRSPFPTVVVEVRSTPPPDFSEAPATQYASSSSSLSQVRPDSDVSAADVQKLEALFGKSAHVKDDAVRQSDDAFFAAIGDHIEEVSSVNPLHLAQKWISSNDPHVKPEAAFTESGTTKVDAGYEYVFTNISMLKDQNNDRQYLVMPHFLSSAATSFEKFAGQVNTIVKLLPDLTGKIELQTFHPEHVDAAMRCPVPVICLQWKAK